MAAEAGGAILRRMQRIVVERPGSYDRLVMREGPALRPGAGEVVVDVRAIGVNYADCVVRMGLYASARELVGWPITPGFEVAGVVRAVGDGVADLAVGDRVVAVTLFGGYATEVCVRRPYVFRVPEEPGFADWAGFPAVYLTAWFALHELAHPRPGARVLVHSAAGGVGGCLVQLARRAGCEVTGVVGASHKVAAARALGAHHVVDKSRQGLWAEAERLAPQGFDVVCDANGVSTLRNSYRHVRRGGKLVVYGFHSMLPKRGGRPRWPQLAAGWLRTPRFDPLAMTQEGRSVLCFNLSYLYDRRDILGAAMGDLLAWLAAGEIALPPVTTLPFDRVADAHRALESGQTTGKLVLVP